VLPTGLPNAIAGECVTVMEVFLHHEITPLADLQAFSRIDGFLREIDVGFVHPATSAQCVLANRPKRC
jgi:hypothetical protein